MGLAATCSLGAFYFNGSITLDDKATGERITYNGAEALEMFAQHMGEVGAISAHFSLALPQLTSAHHSSAFYHHMTTLGLATALTFNVNGRCGCRTQMGGQLRIWGTMLYRENSHKSWAEIFEDIRTAFRDPVSLPAQIYLPFRLHQSTSVTGGGSCSCSWGRS